MKPENRPSKSRGPLGAFRCKDCGGDAFSVSVADLEHRTPIICDPMQCRRGPVGDVRAITKIPSKQIVEETGADVFSKSFHGVAEIALVEVVA